MAKKIRKALAMLLAMVMLVSTMSISAFATETGAGNTITGTITGDAEWNDGDVVGPLTISGGTEDDPITITVNGKVTVDGQISVRGSDDCYVVFEGNGTLIRGANNTGGAVIWVEGNNRVYHNLTIEGITLDGGAVWEGDTHETLDRGTTNTGLSTGGTAPVLFVRYTDAFLSKTTVQNHASSSAKGAAINVGFGKVFLDNSVVCNNYHTGDRGGAIYMRDGATVIAEDTDFYGNHGGAGGVVGTSGSSAYGSVMDFTNCSFTNNYADDGAVFCVQDNRFPVTNSNPPHYKFYAYLNLDDCTIAGNSCKNKGSGLIYSYVYETPVYVKDCTITGNDCNLFGHHALNKNLFLARNTISTDYTGTLSGVPFKVIGALDTMPLNEATISHLMTYGYIATEAEGYSITDADVAQMLGEDASYIKADVDNNGTLDIVPGTLELETDPVTLKDGFSDSDGTKVTPYVGTYPACPFTRTGYEFNGWVKAADDVLVAQWKVAKPEVVTVSASADSVVGIDTEYTLSVIKPIDTETYSYQWLLDGSKIENATEPTLTISGGDLGWHHYTCEVTANNPDAGVIETAVSNTVRVKVLPEPQIEDDDVCYIRETGVGYDTLTVAVGDANERGNATIVMLKDVNQSEPLTITGSVTIIGEHTIYRDVDAVEASKDADDPDTSYVPGDKAYYWDMFTVDAGATLTLDDGITLDGNNNWTLGEYDAANDGYAPTGETGKPRAGGGAYMIQNNGTLNVLDATLQNQYGNHDYGKGWSGAINVGNDSVTTLDGATIKHIASNDGGTAVFMQNGSNAVLNIKGDTLITDIYGGANASIIRAYGTDTINMSGGTISNCYCDFGGSLMYFFNGCSMNFTGGTITNNWGNGNGVFYLHGGTEFDMTDGTISNNTFYTSAIYGRSNASSLTISGGTIIDNTATYTAYAEKDYNDFNATISYTKITGGIYTQDVDKWCAPGYVCIPYDETARTDDYIVVPGYKVSYYTVETNAETGETTTQFVDAELLPIPDGKTAAEVDLFATPYRYVNSDNTKVIKDWYTDEAMTTVFDYGTEITQNVKLYGGTWEEVDNVIVTVNDATYVDGNPIPTEFSYTAEDGIPALNLTYTVDVEKGVINATVADVDGYLFTVVPGKLIKKEAIAEIDGVYYASIRDAVNDAQTGDTVKVLKDHEIDVSELTQKSVIFIDGSKIENLTIDFNGKTVTANTGDNTSGNVWTIFYACYGANVTFTGDGNVNIVGDDANRPYLFWASASTITVEDGTYIMDGSLTQGAKNGAVSHTFYASSGGHIYVKNGYYGNINSVIDLMNIYDGSGSTITVTGGTYTEYFPDTNQPWEVTVPEGYTIIDNRNGTWSVSPYITVTFADKTMVVGNRVPELTYTIDYNYLGKEVVGVNVVATAISNPAVGNHTITGTVTLTDGTGDADNYAVKVVNGTLTVKENPNPGSGYRPSGSRPSNRPSTVVIEDELVPLAGGPQWLNTTDHYAYLAGFGDGTLRPYGGITRGQVATIFFRLLTDEAREEFWSETNNFTDCGEDLWCNTAISTLSNMGIISGYEDGTFRPNVKVTRAQFAKIMVGFFGVDQMGYFGLFSDVAEGAWHSQYVETANRLGLIQGYSDGTFKPNANITRAQACVIVNRALVRVPDEEHLLPLDEMLTWTDNTPDDWFYADMMEATSSHDYMWLETETDTMEQWTEKLAQPDWAKLEKVWSETYGG